MKYLVWLTLIISLGAIINEVAYIGDTNLAWVIIALSAAVGILSIYLLVEKR